MTATPYEYDPETGAQGEQLEILGQMIAYEGVEGESPGVYIPLDVVFAGDAPTPVLIPGTPTLSGSLTSRTQASLAWTAGTVPPGTPPVTTWEVQRRESTNNGGSFGAWDDIAASPVAGGTTIATDTGLTTGTPEIYFEYRVRGVNIAGAGPWSNPLPLQWTSTPVGQPTAPSGVVATLQSATSVQLTWNATANASVTKFGIFQAGVLVVDNIPITQPYIYLWTGLTPGQAYSQITVRRWNGQWSNGSNAVSFTMPYADPIDFTMMIGCSASDNDHGGTDQWEGWRIYSRSTMLTYANKTGLERPDFIAYSVDGPPLWNGIGGINAATYDAIYSYVLSELNNFYYNNTANTQSSRWGIKLFWSNGNENSDKGVLSPEPTGTSGHTDTQVANFVLSQRALYDAVHYAPGGVRRFPDAYAGTNPTQEQERKGWVQKYLHAAAQYCDFVMWSMYPPGRGVNDPNLSRNPRLDWPTFDVSLRNNLQRGYIMRCMYRTYEAQKAARIALGQDPNTGTFQLMVACGEVGQASDPDDRSQRPYFAVHGLFGAMWITARMFGLAMPFACWWDNATTDQGETVVTTDSPHNILSDEPPNSDHLAFGGGAAAGNNATATNPSTRVAIQNWMLYDKRQPGSSQPAQWAGNPKSTWDFSGTQV